MNAAAAQPRIAQTAGFKSGDLAAIVEIGQHGAVMFTAGKEGHSLAAKEKVVRTLRMQADGIGVEGLQQESEQQTKRVSILILQALLANN